MLYYETHLSTKQVAPHLHQIDGYSNGASNTRISDVFQPSTAEILDNKVTVLASKLYNCIQHNGLRDTG